MSRIITKLSIATTGAAFIALGLIGTAQAATLIDTTPSWNGLNSVAAFGESNTATYGQTFTVGIDNILDSFTFFLNRSAGQQDVVDFAAYVTAWDGTKATGPILYQSGPQSTTRGSGFEEFTFNTGGINLTSGNQHVAFLSASNFFDGFEGTSSMGYLFQDVYSGGGFVFSNNGSDFSSLTTNSWQTFVGNGVDDTAFKASFSSSSEPVPEPLTILGSGLALGFGSLMKRQQSRKLKKTSVAD